MSLRIVHHHPSAAIRLVDGREVSGCESCSRTVYRDEDEGCYLSAFGGYFCAACLNESARQSGMPEKYATRHVAEVPHGR